jgi:hypothetical protein
MYQTRLMFGDVIIPNGIQAVVLVNFGNN